MLNDEERKVEWFVDAAFLQEKRLIGVHPNDNTATVWLNTNDLIGIIQEHGNTVHVVEV